MKTAVEELIEYFVKQQKEGCSHWCIHDLIAQLYVAKLIEKEQIVEAYCNGCLDITKDENIFPRETSEQYYNETFKTN